MHATTYHVYITQYQQTFLENVCNVCIYMGLPIEVISPVKSIIFLRFYRETAWVNEMTDSARVFEVLKQTSFDLPYRDYYRKR